jgi:hypothetical protein
VVQVFNSYIVAELSPRSLQGLWDVDASIVSPDSDGLAALRLHGVEMPQETPLVRLGPKVDTVIHFDGAHWTPVSPDGPRFGLYEPTK